MQELAAFYGKGALDVQSWAGLRFMAKEHRTCRNGLRFMAKEHWLCRAGLGCLLFDTGAQDAQIWAWLCLGEAQEAIRW